MSSSSFLGQPPRYLGPLCHALRWLCLGVAAFVILALFGIVLGAFLVGDNLGPNFKVTSNLEGMPFNAWTIGTLGVAAGIPIAALVWGLWHGSRLFKGLGRGEYFARPTAMALRNFAFGLLGYKLLPFVTVPLWALGTGHIDAVLKAINLKRINVDLKFDPFQMDGVLTIIFLGMIAVFAQIMTKAVEIAEDNAQIV